MTCPTDSMDSVDERTSLLTEQLHFKCDNTGRWGTVAVMTRCPLYKPADKLWLKGCYSGSGTYRRASVLAWGACTRDALSNFQKSMFKKDRKRVKNAREEVKN